MKHRRNSKLAERRGAQSRSGAVIVESAIVLGAFLIVLFGMLDLGLVVMHHNTLSEGARRLARNGMTHGSLAGPDATVWGPAPVSGTVADGSEFAESIRPIFVTIPPDEISFNLEWPDGDNKAGQRIRATVGYQHQMMFPFVLGGAVALESASTMRIAH